MQNLSRLANLPGQWGLLKVVVGDRVVEIWGKLVHQGKGVMIQSVKFVNGKGKVVKENHHNRNVVDWQPHYDKR